MKWVIALFLALLSIPVVQVAADAWSGRPGAYLSVMRPQAGRGLDFAVTRHHHFRLYDPIAPWLSGRAKTG
jgi:hypothetical protein